MEQPFHEAGTAALAGVPTVAEPAAVSRRWASPAGLLSQLLYPASVLFAPSCRAAFNGKPDSAQREPLPSPRLFVCSGPGSWRQA